MVETVDAAVADRIVAIRRDLHRYPELSWEEHRTAELISSRLDELGIANRRVLDTGVVADLGDRRGMPRVAIRADIDALPVQEETELSFASVNKGVMHACGHDGHTSMLLGAAELLTREEDLPTPVRLIFQPAEEKGAGAKAMLEAGAMEEVAVAFAGHLDRHFPTGTLVVTDGAVSASTDVFRIVVMGSGGHAARPHEAVDAVVVGSLIVLALQTIVSREIDPAHPSIVTVGRFDAGTASNVIAGRAILEGTIRAQDPGVREHLKKSIHRIAVSIGELHQSGLEVEIQEGTPAVINTPKATEIARQAAIAVVGKERVRALGTANMGGEDFSHFLRHVPGCYIRFGARTDGRENFPAHSSRFDIDEDALPIGAAWMAEIAKRAGLALVEGRLRESTPEAAVDEVLP